MKVMDYDENLAKQELQEKVNILFIIYKYIQGNNTYFGGNESF